MRIEIFIIQVSVEALKGLPGRVSDSSVKFKFFDYNETQATPYVAGMNPKFNHSSIGIT